jgi:TonB family protein
MSGAIIFFGIAVKATVVLLVTLVLWFALRRASSSSRMALWNVAFASLLALPLLSLALPSWSPPGGTGNQPVFHTTFDMLGPSAPLSPGPARSVHVQPAAEVSWGEIGIAVWLLGVSIVMGRLFIGMLRVRGIAKRAARVTESRCLAIRDELGRRLAVRRTPVLLETNRALPPMTWGLAQPAILLPESAREWPMERLRIVLAHELIHVRRFDYFSQIAAHITCALYWFHPLVWLAAGQLSKERELSCDDEVLNMGTKGTEYAEHLVGIVRALSCPANVWSTVTGMLPAFEGRVAAILDETRNRRAPSKRTAVIGAIVAAGLLLPLAALRAPAQDSGANVAGVVRDASGATIPDAMVTMLSADKRNMQAASTNDEGRYEFPNIPAGRYTLEVTKPGFAVYQQPDVVVGPSGPIRHDAVLDLGAIRERVEVVGKATESARSNSVVAPHRVRVGGNVQASRLISKVQPTYPAQAEQAGVQGTVLLHAIIGTDGHLLSLGVANSSANPDLANAAMVAVRQWVYQPTLLNGAPVEVVTTVAVVFRLKP